MTAYRVEPGEALDVAADAEAPIADKLSGVVIDRQRRQFDRKAAAAIERPVQGDAAPGAAGRDRLDDLAVRIEAERLGEFAPWPAEASGGAHADQAAELVGAQRETAIGVHLPGKAERMSARLRRGLLDRCVCLRRCFV